MIHADDPDAFRDAVRRDLRAAVKSRQSDVISTLRTVIAAIDNAEAAPPSAQTPRYVGGAVAHSSPGVGSTEVPRRTLTMPDVHAIVGELIGEYEAHRDHYRSLGRHDAAERLQRHVEILRAYVPQW